MSKGLAKKIEEIILRAGEESEKLIRVAVLRRMKSRKNIHSFVFAMGHYSFADKEGHLIEQHPVGDNLLYSLQLHLKSFGTMTWLVKKDEDGNLVQSYDW